MVQARIKPTSEWTDINSLPAVDNDGKSVTLGVVEGNLVRLHVLESVGRTFYYSGSKPLTANVGASVPMDTNDRFEVGVLTGGLWLKADGKSSIVVEVVEGA